MSPGLPADEEYAEDERSPSGGGGTGFLVLYAVFGVLGSLCVIVIIIVVVCRCKAKRTLQLPDNGHATQSMDTAMAIPTDNSIDNVPTATETDLPIETATLTMPPVLMEDMDALPVAVSPIYR